MGMTEYEISIRVTDEQVRDLRREMLTVMVVVPTIAGLIESIEDATGITARSTVIGDMGRKKNDSPTA